MSTTTTTTALVVPCAVDASDGTIAAAACAVRRRHAQQQQQQQQQQPQQQHINHSTRAAVAATASSSPPPHARSSSDVLDELMRAYTGCRSVCAFAQLQCAGAALHDSVRTRARFAHAAAQPRVPAALSQWLHDCRERQPSQTTHNDDNDNDDSDDSDDDDSDDSDDSDDDDAGQWCDETDAVVCGVSASRLWRRARRLTRLPPYSALPQPLCCDAAALQRLRAHVRRYLARLMALLLLTHTLQPRWGRLCDAERRLLRRTLATERCARGGGDSRNSSCNDDTTAHATIHAAQAVYDCFAQLDLAARDVVVLDAALQRCRHVRQLRLSHNARLRTLTNVPASCAVLLASACALEHVRLDARCDAKRDDDNDNNTGDGVTTLPPLPSASPRHTHVTRHDGRRRRTTNTHDGVVAAASLSSSLPLLPSPSSSCVVLALSHNRLRHVRFVRQLPLLRTLDVAHNRVNDLAETVWCVQSHPSLVEVHVRGNPIALLDRCRRALVRSCARLQVVDAAVVVAAEERPCGGGGVGDPSMSTMRPRDTNSDSDSNDDDASMTAVDSHGDAVLASLQLLRVAGVSTLAHRALCVHTLDEVQPHAPLLQYALTSTSAATTMTTVDAMDTASLSTTTTTTTTSHAHRNNNNNNSRGSSTHSNHSNSSSTANRVASSRRKSHTTPLSPSAAAAAAASVAAAAAAVPLYECTTTLRVLGTWAACSDDNNSNNNNNDNGKMPCSDSSATHSAQCGGVRVQLECLSVTPGVGDDGSGGHTESANDGSRAHNDNKTPTATAAARHATATTTANASAAVAATRARTRKPATAAAAVATTTTRTTSSSADVAAMRHGGDADGSGSDDAMVLSASVATFTARLPLCARLCERLRQPIVLHVYVHDTLHFRALDTLALTLDDGRSSSNSGTTAQRNASTAAATLAVCSSMSSHTSSSKSSHVAAAVAAASPPAHDVTAAVGATSEQLQQQQQQQQQYVDELGCIVVDPAALLQQQQQQQQQEQQEQRHECAPQQAQSPTVRRVCIRGCALQLRHTTAAHAALAHAQSDLRRLVERLAALESSLTAAAAAAATTATSTTLTAEMRRLNNVSLASLPTVSLSSLAMATLPTSGSTVCGAANNSTSTCTTTTASEAVALPHKRMTTTTTTAVSSRTASAASTALPSPTLRNVSGHAGANSQHAPQTSKTSAAKNNSASASAMSTALPSALHAPPQPSHPQQSMQQQQRLSTLQAERSALHRAVVEHGIRVAALQRRLRELASASLRVDVQLELRDASTVDEAEAAAAATQAAVIASAAAATSASAASSLGARNEATARRSLAAGKCAR